MNKDKSVKKEDINTSEENKEVTSMETKNSRFFLNGCVAGMHKWRNGKCADCGKKKK